MDSSNTSSPLIDLPREVRNLIYSNLIPEEISLQLQEIQYFCPSWGRNYVVPFNLPESKYQLVATDSLDVLVFKALLAVNNQVRAEWQHEVGRSDIGLLVDMRGQSGASDHVVPTRQSSKTERPFHDIKNFINAFHHVRHLRVITVDGRVMKNLHNDAQSRRFLSQSDILLTLTNGSVTVDVRPSIVEKEPKSFANENWDAAMLAETKQHTAEKMVLALNFPNYPPGDLKSPTLVSNIYFALHFGRNNSINPISGFWFTRVLQASYVRQRFHHLKGARDRDASVQIEFDWSMWDEYTTAR